MDHRFTDETSPNVEVGTRVEEQKNITDCNAEYLVNRYFSLGLLYHQEYHHFLTPGQIDNRLFGDDTFLALLRLRGLESNSPSKYAEAFYCQKMLLL